MIFLTSDNIDARSDHVSNTDEREIERIEASIEWRFEDIFFQRFRTRRSSVQRKQFLDYLTHISVFLFKCVLLVSFVEYLYHISTINNHLSYPYGPC